MKRLQKYVGRYGPIAGPKLFHAVQSRAAFIGASRRRAREIEQLTGRPIRVRRAPSARVEAPAEATPAREEGSLFPARTEACVACP